MIGLIAIEMLKRRILCFFGRHGGHVELGRFACCGRKFRGWRW